MDTIVRMTAANLELRAFAIQSRDLVEKARQAHGTCPVATAALGRLLSAGAMMGQMQKNEGDLLTLQIKCDGPIGGLCVTADGSGHVKGYAYNPVFEGFARSDHKLDVGGALGYGTLTVIRDMGLKEPFAGTVELLTGEIAEDLTYYFASSEQLPSTVGLGVLLNKEDGSVSAAGGFIIQVMPGAKEETIAKLEENLSGIKSVTELLSHGHTAESLLRLLLSGLDPKEEGRSEPSFYCDCSREKTEKALLLLGRKELQKLAEEEEVTEIKCHFCNTAYHFSSAEIRELLDRKRVKSGKEN